MRDALDARVPLMHRSGAAVLRLLDTGLLLCEECVRASLRRRRAASRARSGALIEPGAIFTLLEQLVEGSTLADCEAAVSWVEAKRGALASPTLWGRGKLILLRTANELLRRLSRAAAPVLAGRVLLLLAALFPLSERSALNMQGAYARTPTEWEAPDAAAVALGEADGAGGVSVELYESLWALQAFCSHPPSALTPAGWVSFAGKTATVLSALEGDPLEGGGCGGGSGAQASSASEQQNTGTAPGGAGSVSDGEPPLGCVADDTGSRYLTSAKLLKLELRDASFRRSLLLQLRLVLGFVLGPPPPPGPQQLRGKAGEEAAALGARVAACLLATPPAGGAFVAAAEASIARDANWAAWKAAGCKPFERPPRADAHPPPQQQQTAQPAAESGAAAPPSTMRRRAPPPPVAEKRFRLGVPALDRLWNGFDSLAAATQPGAPGCGAGAPPETLAFAEPLREQLDASFCEEAGLEECLKRKHDKVFVWRALRLTARSHLPAFGRAAERDGGADVDNIVRELFNVPRPPKAGEKHGAEGGAAPAAAQAGAHPPPDAAMEEPPPPDATADGGAVQTDGGAAACGEAAEAGAAAAATEAEADAGAEAGVEAAAADAGGGGAGEHADGAAPACGDGGGGGDAAAAAAAEAALDALVDEHSGDA